MQPRVCYFTRRLGTSRNHACPASGLTCIAYTRFCTTFSLYPGCQVIRGKRDEPARDTERRLHASVTLLAVRGGMPHECVKFSYERFSAPTSRQVQITRASHGPFSAAVQPYPYDTCELINIPRCTSTIIVCHKHPRLTSRTNWPTPQQ